ncbi:uncharacterized protein B0T15DRAFT_563232 [Chaetomium strumarium]|uniref:Peptidase C1A papain C-terminal domain-containing protein n=1 Tax=Chaetomium strumarium TaxID=1170767 RepID=A0AAJ0GKS9_9PEZI|nr:hypothetical protein B0T15DRAFT_563232 [Chaetomium strumarium]
MAWPWQTSLALILAVSVASNPLQRPRQLPWPDPIPASSIGPLDWSSIHPPIFNNPNKGYSLRFTTTPPLLPSSVDWRNRSGLNYITTPQNQGVCNSCWAFAVTALIEAMVRIEHGAWSKRSEADVHDGLGAACESTGNAEETLAWVAGQGAMFVVANNNANTSTDPDAASPGPGIADWPCDPYQDTPPQSHAYGHCADRSGRTTRIPLYQALGVVEDQKRWLDQYGPLVATFVLYADFGAWKPTGENQGVYRWDGVSESTGNHLALVVGYDDGKQAWIMKNSWGQGWGDGGFVYFAYDIANIDSWTKYGLSNVNPDPWTRRRHQSGSMMQSGNGDTHRNFELLISDSNAPGFTHVSRDGNSTTWSKVSEIQGSSLVGQPAIIGTSFNRDFHAVGITKDQTLQQWAYSQSAKKWSQVSTIEDTKIDGFPGLTQSDGSQLVMVVKHADGTLNEWQQQPNSTTWTLASPPHSPIASNIAQSGPSLIQSNINLDLYHPLGGTSHGNLYTVAVRTDGRLQLFWRSSSSNQNNTTTSTRWSAGEVFASDIPLDTPPVMIQDFFHTRNETSVGGFQLVVATADGGVQHWERVNDDDDDIGTSTEEEEEQEEGKKWRLVETVAGGSRVRHVWALVQGSFDRRMQMVTEGVDGDRRHASYEYKSHTLKRDPSLR